MTGKPLTEQEPKRVYAKSHDEARVFLLKHGFKEYAAVPEEDWLRLKQRLAEAERERDEWKRLYDERADIIGLAQAKAALERIVGLDPVRPMSMAHLIAREALAALERGDE